MVLSLPVPAATITFFEQQATQKIQSEGWEGRDKELKKKNFLRCWITEEAFKQVLISRGIWFRHRGLYFGDAPGAGPDFMVRKEGKEISLGLRSIGEESLLHWKSVPYPDDRFRLEKETIADYHVVCFLKEETVAFLGMVEKNILLRELSQAGRKYSRGNQEYFRVIPLERFSPELMKRFLSILDSK